jgi:hypothetical protein
MPSPNDLVDFTNELIVVPLVIENCKTYATINTEMAAEEDGIGYVGTFLVYLLHPKKGSTQFSFDYDRSKKKWVAQNAPSWITTPIIHSLTTQLPGLKII